MRVFACMLTMAAALAAHAAEDAAKTAAAQPANQAKKAPARMTVPQDAVETSPGLYRWTDKDGKVWMYRRSPFGVSRFPAEPGYAKPDSGKEQVTAVEQGDSIRFERTTPFGKRTWVRKKDELTETEKTIWERQQKDAAPAAADKE
jgi:hypothetical protein